MSDDIEELIPKKVSLEFVDEEMNHAKTIEYDFIDSLRWDREPNIGHNADGMILIDSHTITMNFDVQPRDVSSYEEKDD